MYYTWVAVSGKWEQSHIAADSSLFVGMLIDATPAIIVLGTVKIP